MWDPFESPNVRLDDNYNVTEDVEYTPTLSMNDMQKVNGDAIFRSIKWTFQASKKEFLTLVLLAGLGSLFYAFLYPISRNILEKLTNIHSINPSFYRSLIIVLALLLAKKIVDTLRSIWGWKVSQLFSFYGYNRVMKHKLYGPLTNFDNSTFFDSIRKAENALGLIEETGGRVVSLLTNLLSAIVVTITLIFWEPWFIPVVIIAIIPTLFGQIKSNKIRFIAAVQGSWQNSLRYMVSEYSSKKGYASDIRAYQNADNLNNIAKTAWHDSIILDYGILKKITKIGLTSQIFTSSLIIIGAAIVFVSKQGNLNEMLSLGLASILGLTQLFHNYSAITSAAASIAEYSLYLKLVDDLDENFELEPQKPSIPNDLETPTIECVNVNYKYPSRETNSLNNINFTAQSGKITAIVGQNGSGKTTLMKIIAGLYTPTSGEILWNDTSYEQIYIKNHTSIQFQQPAQWPFTLKENITLNDSDEIFMNKVNVVSDILDFAEKLPKKYATRLTQELGDGIDISGGQWQKVGIAKALYREPKLLILDEATSALDVFSEQKLLSTLKNHFKNKTILLVTHRLSNISIADNILVVDNGEIVEQGTFKQLMENQSVFYEMYSTFKQTIE